MNEKILAQTLPTTVILENISGGLDFSNESPRPRFDDDVCVIRPGGSNGDGNVDYSNSSGSIPAYYGPRPGYHG